uniref:PD-(D/E)XK nuclease superfamily protein n=1 Tax=Candidatus Kentrum sp. FM TaxID=2126340 RepID=A0A450TV69_9GAMM|nr:MAG: PD-(D/E)XK nuclease superfamily protein [Candidatus Kentron sp. FM]VFJ72865.1 MAG: PD-(D/E)XK nuclease superfamily protein [Candidatus Kentron sp. FM]VFK20440.1 MAG: PD-(D/E)XK nuclease superfamily protein [Candidatus Kentron sp. FM]
MKFPYGIANFHALITEGYFYADRTDHIASLEAAGKQLLFLRPRRFGKSLVLSMLENYYDVAKAAEFERLFGHLKIGPAPTARHNRYFIMRWDFSMVASHGDTVAIERALHDHINVCVQGFMDRYREHLPQTYPINPDNALASFHAVVNAVSLTAHELYLFIDEYDNFANEVLTAQMKGRDRYETLVHGEGILKTVFKVIKSLGSGQGLDRVFITGVSPVVMSDISSGYNVAKDISLRAGYHDLCGFYESEISDALARVGRECALPDAGVREALSMMRTFYNGYRFGYGDGALVYNPTLALYFLDNYQEECAYPRKILDSNLAMDRNRIEYIARLPHGNELIAQILDPREPALISELTDRFGVQDMFHATKDQPFLASLMYYLGVLTIADRDAMGRLTLRIPNLVIRRLYVERIRDAILPEYEDREVSRRAAEHFYTSGELSPLCDFIERRYFQVFDNRDYRWTNELVVKTAFLVVLFSDTFYIMDSETAIDKGYADLSMIVRPDMRRYALLDHLLEFKYIPLKELDLSGQEVRDKSREELRRLPRVAAALEEAREQLSRHRATLEQVYGEKLRLRTHAVAALGLERLVW